MSPAPKTSVLRTRSRSESSDTDGAHLRVVDSDTYTDWESVYRDNIGRLYRLMYAAGGKSTRRRGPHL